MRTAMPATVPRCQVMTLRRLSRITRVTPIRSARPAG